MASWTKATEELLTRLETVGADQSAMAQPLMALGQGQSYSGVTAASRWKRITATDIESPTKRTGRGMSCMYVGKNGRR